MLCVLIRKVSDNKVSLRSNINMSSLSYREMNILTAWSSECFKSIDSIDLKHSEDHACIEWSFFAYFSLCLFCLLYHSM